jgi:hypothetical protein
MNVWMIDSLVHVSDKGIVELQHGKVYSVPDSWGRLMLEGRAAAEYIEVLR